MISGDNSTNFAELRYDYFQNEYAYETNKIPSKDEIAFVEALFETETPAESPISIVEKIQRSTEGLLKNTGTVNQLQHPLSESSKKNAKHLKTVESKGDSASREEFIQAVNNVIESANGEALSNSEIINRLMRDVYPKTNKNAIQQRIGRLLKEGMLPKIQQKSMFLNFEIGIELKENSSDEGLPTTKKISKKEFIKAVKGVMDSARGKELSNLELANRLKERACPQATQSALLKRIGRLRAEGILFTTKKVSKKEFANAVKRVIQTDEGKALSNLEVANELRKSRYPETNLPALVKRIDRLQVEGILPMVKKPTNEAS